MGESEKIKIRAGEISLLDDDIIIITMAANYEITIEDVDEIDKHVVVLTRNQPYFAVTITQQGSTASKETKEYAAKESFRKNIIAQAIVIANIAVRLMATTYMRINRPKQKIKLFNSREEALRWIHLLKIRGKNTNSN